MIVVVVVVVVEVSPRRGSKVRTFNNIDSGQVPQPVVGCFVT